MMPKSNLIISLCFLSLISALAQELIPIKENNKWGYINLQSEKIIQPQFDQAQPFENNLAVVRISTKCGVINSKGITVIPIEESEINIIHKKYISYRKDTLWGIYSSDGKLISTPKYTSIELLNDNFLLLSINTQKGIFSTINEKIIEPIFSNITLKKPLLITQINNGLVGSIDTTLNINTKPEYNAIEVIDNNFTVLKSKDWWALANKNGDLITKHDFQNYKLITNDLIALKTKKGGWSLYNLTLNKFILQDEQENFSIIDKDFILIHKSHKYGVINTNGGSILGQNFSNIHLNDGLFLVEQQGKWGLYDKLGVVVIPTIHDKIFPFKKNISIFETPTGKGVISNKGKIIVQPNYNSIKIVGNTAKCTKIEGKIENFKVDAAMISGAKGVVKKSNKLPLLSPEITHSHAWIKGTGKKWGLIGHDTLFIGYKFDDIIEYDANTSLVTQKIDYRTNAKLYGYINSNKIINLTTQKIGLANKATGLVLAQPQFWHIFLEDFEKNDFARVILEGGTMALLQKTGKVISEIVTTKDKKQIKYKFDYISKSKENVIRFCSGCYVNYEGDWANPKVENGKWGYLNTNATLLLDPNFDFCTDFSNDRAIVQYKGLFGLINSSANFILKPEYQNLSFVENTDNQYIKFDVKKEKFGLIREDGKLLTSINFEKIFPFHDGLARVMIQGKYGYIDSSQTLVIPAIYDNANDFEENMAAVFTKNKWGFINQKGEMKILPTYISAANFKNGLALVFKDGKKSFINSDEKILVTLPFINCSEFSNGYATIINEKKKIGLINTFGEVVIEPKYDEVTSLGNTALFKVKEDGEYKIYSILTKKIISKKSYTDVSNVSEGLIKVKIDNYYNFIDTTGKVIINKKYTSASDFVDGLAKVNLENKNGFISPSGFTVLDFVYGNVLDFNQGFSFAEGVGKLWKIIDRNGRNITFDVYSNPKKFENGYAVIQTRNKKFKWVNSEGIFSFGTTTFDNLITFKDSLARCKTTKWGLAHASGYYPAPPKYDFISDFYRQQAVVGLYSNSGIFDIDGKKIVDPLYDNIQYLGKNIFKLEKGDAIGYYSTVQNKWISEIKR